MVEGVEGAFERQPLPADTRLAKSPRKRKMIKTIIFDFGGVVVNSFGRALLRYASQVLGIETFKLRKLMDKYEGELQTGKIDHIKFWQKICQEKGIFVPEEKLETIWVVPYKKDTQVKKDVVNLVKDLKKRYIVGLISNTHEPHISFNKKRGVLKLFEPCLLSSEVGLRKPDKRIFKLYLKRANCKPQEAIFIDDQKEKLIPAKELGMKTILFKSRKELEEKLATFQIKIGSKKSRKQRCGRTIDF